MLRGGPRRHLLEIHEQDWCPRVIREGATDYLRFVATTARQYNRAVPLLCKGLTAAGSERIVDLCSGGGGPWPALQPELEAALGRPVPVLLTDLYPSRAAAELSGKDWHTMEVAPLPVDATAVAPDLTGFRTLFTSFHHFTPRDARKILQDAVDSGQGIAVFEQTDRTLIALLTMLVLPWLAMLAAPFVRPFRLGRLFWTWAIPLIPLVLCFDGIVSCLRTYSTDELHELISGVDSSGACRRYVWEIGRVRSPLSPIGVGYLMGVPVREDAVGSPAGTT